MDKKRFKSHEEYVDSLPNNKRVLVKQLRSAIKQATPDATEVISYNMPAYKYHGMLMYLCAHTEHIGFYPFSSAIRTFRDKLKKYETSKGTVKFPLGKPIPVSLVKNIVRFRVQENLEKESLKAKKKKR